ncbi:MAG: hypothetical protein WCO55_01060 [Candidatus Falkowbacteria bacterium]
MGELMSMADEVQKITAICFVCGDPATMSYKIVKGRKATDQETEVIDPGDENYQARCRQCWSKQV